MSDNDELALLMKSQGKLNHLQKKAVKYTAGHELVIAGAGTGKTSVLTHKIAYLIKSGYCQAYQICALTFTNKAAREMRERIFELVGQEAQDISIGTFHSLCARWLRQYGSAMGLKSNFTIYDISDQKRIMRKAMGQLNLDHKRLHPKALLEYIERFKRKGELANATNVHEFDYIGKQAQKVYPVYQRMLKQANALDFSDLIFQTVLLLQNHADVRERLQRRFKYVLIDEYQDTNDIQIKLITTLRAPWIHVFAVGDDDQSIYTWRGANPHNILRFEQSFPDAITIKLEENYRSTTQILDLANQLVAANTNRHPKKLFTKLDEGSEPELYIVKDPYQEAMLIAEKIKVLHQRGISYNEQAVLYRTNAQSRIFEEVFREHGLPYTLIGALRFFDRAEIKDALAYMRLIQNPDSDADFERIIHRPNRGIGKVSLERIAQLAESKGCSLVQALLAGQKELKAIKLSAKAYGAGSQLAKKIILYHEKIQQLSLGELLNQALNDVGYLDYIQQHDSTGEKADNVYELLALAHQRADSGLSFEDFLTELSLLSAVDKDDKGTGSVILMTLHAAKGLEFPYVYLAGLEEGMLPHSNALRAQEQGKADARLALEEERRLCYVGITRAKRSITLTAAMRRPNNSGSWRMSQLSRFAQEFATPEMKVYKSTGQAVPNNCESMRPMRSAYDDFDMDDEDLWL